MIEPELLLVDEITFQRVSNICGEQVAIELCCVDHETAQAVKQMVDIIQGGVRSEQMDNAQFSRLANRYDRDIVEPQILVES